MVVKKIKVRVSTLFDIMVFLMQNKFFLNITEIFANRAVYDTIYIEIYNVPLLKNCVIFHIINVSKIRSNG